MKRFINTHKKALAALAAVAVVAGSGIGAYAYFTSTGSGTGSASTGTSSTLTVSVLAATHGPMLPSAEGDANATPQTINYTVLNTIEGDQNFKTVTVTATTNFSSTAVDALLPPCVPGDYAISFDGGTTWTALSHTAGAGLSSQPNGTTGETLLPDTDAPGAHTEDYPTTASGGSLDNDTFFGSFQIMLVENSANQNNCENYSPSLTVAAS